MKTDEEWRRPCCPSRSPSPPPPLPQDESLPPVSSEEFEALCAAQTQLTINRSYMTTSQNLQEAQVGSMTLHLIVLPLTTALQSVLNEHRTRLTPKQERDLHFRSQAQANRVTGEGLGSAYLARLFQLTKAIQFGVDCVGVKCVVFFEPYTTRTEFTGRTRSNLSDLYQQMGQAGRDGTLTDVVFMLKKGSKLATKKADLMDVDPVEEMAQKQRQRWLGSEMKR